MEEESSKGWEIQEYSLTGDMDGKVMSRIIRRGLRISKTVIVAGVVITFAPFVLPPLLVVSAVGLACSFPFGAFVASYACAEKLMSKLLPMPRPPPPLLLMLEYKGYSQADEISYIDFESEGSEGDTYGMEQEELDSKFPLQVSENADNEGFVEMVEDHLAREAEEKLDSMIPLQYNENADIEGYVDMNEEEERLLEDTRRTVEMRISLPVGEETESIPVEKYYEGKAEVEERKVEEGYLEDEESSSQQEGQSTTIPELEISEEIHPLVEILRQERPIDNVNMDAPNLTEKTHGDVTCRVVEVEGPYGLTIGTVEQAGSGTSTRGNTYQGKPSMAQPIDMEGQSERDMPTNDIKDCGDKFAENLRTIKIDEVHDTGVEDRPEKSGVIETVIYTPSDQIMKTTLYEDAATKSNKSEQSVDIAPTIVNIVGEIPSTQIENLDNKLAATDAASTTKRKKKGKKKKAKSGEVTTEGTILNIHSKELQEGAVSSTTDANNINVESSLNLVGDKKRGEEIQTDTKAADIVQPNKSGSTSRTPSGRSHKESPKALFSEEKIWENIEALRTIVGYRAARHQTCMEELKALYIFTGVEPPMSFKSSPDATHSPDLVEVNDKLRFLMAIVGVK